MLLEFPDFHWIISAFSISPVQPHPLFLRDHVNPCMQTNCSNASRHCTPPQCHCLNTNNSQSKQSDTVPTASLLRLWVAWSTSILLTTSMYVLTLCLFSLLSHKHQGHHLDYSVTMILSKLSTSVPSLITLGFYL
jgi:hypothetical protein